MCFYIFIFLIMLSFGILLLSEDESYTLSIFIWDLPLSLIVYSGLISIAILISAFILVNLYLKLGFKWKPLTLLMSFLERIGVITSFLFSLGIGVIFPLSLAFGLFGSIINYWTTDTEGNYLWERNQGDYTEKETNDEMGYELEDNSDSHHVESHWVDDYERSDGTEVDGYWRGGDHGYERSDPGSSFDSDNGDSSGGFWEF